MQLQFSKKKPTRIGMQFLFYESLYAVGIIANFNKTLGNHSCLMHLIWKLFVKWALNCGKCNKECKSWHRLYWKFRIYFYSYRLSSMRVIINLPSLVSSKTYNNFIPFLNMLKVHKYPKVVPHFFSLIWHFLSE